MPAKGIDKSARHRYWKTKFESRLGHTEDLKNCTYELRPVHAASCSVLNGFKEKLHARFCHWPATSASFTAKLTAWP